MKRQVRPFIVEVKQKRGIQKRGHSIWGDLDLSAVMEETTGTSDPMNLPDVPLVDSSAIPIDAENEYKTRAEYHMPDPQETESSQIVAEAPVTPHAVKLNKKAPHARKAKAKQPARKDGAEPASKAAEVPAAAVRTARKVHSSKERTQKLGQIEKAIGSGETIKSAVKQVGISEQTYYQWKKAAPASDSGDLKDLLALEAENKRLKNLLAERLRKENAELKKKLGLA